jgi:hypothetical protein
VNVLRPRVTHDLDDRPVDLLNLLSYLTMHRERRLLSTGKLSSEFEILVRESLDEFADYEMTVENAALRDIVDNLSDCGFHATPPKVIGVTGIGISPHQRPSATRHASGNDSGFQKVARQARQTRATRFISSLR